MTSLDEFTKLLHETVSKNKLSTSRVDNVKQLAMKNFHDSDTVISILHKEHSRSSSTSKLSSLYIFDAILRHAKDIVKKDGSDFDPAEIQPPKGSKSTAGTREALVESARAFLNKVEKGAENLVVDTMKRVPIEQREKVKKVLVIWRRTSTFDPAKVKEIEAKADQAEKDAASDKQSSGGVSGSSTSKGKEKEKEQAKKKASTHRPTPTDSKAASSSSASASKDPRRSSTLDPRKRPPQSSSSTSTRPDSSESKDGGNGGGSTTPPQAPVGLPSHLLALLGAQTKPSGEPASSSPSHSSNPNQISSPTSSGLSAATSVSQEANMSLPSSILPPDLGSTSNIPGVPKDFMESLASMLEKSDTKKSTQPPEPDFSRPPPPLQRPDFSKPPPPISQPNRTSREVESGGGPPKPLGMVTRERGGNIRSPSQHQNSSPSNPTGGRRLNSIPTFEDSRTGRNDQTPRSRSKSPTRRSNGAGRVGTDSSKASRDSTSNPKASQDPNAKAQIDQVEGALRPDPTVGDLSSFDLQNFNPSREDDWKKLGKMWYNTHGYFPSNQELMSNVMQLMMMSGMMMPSGGFGGMEPYPSQGSSDGWQGQNFEENEFAVGTVGTAGMGMGMGMGGNSQRQQQGQWN